MRSRQVVLGFAALSAAVCSAVAADVEKVADSAQRPKASHALTGPQAAEVVCDARERNGRQASPDCVKALLDAGHYEMVAQLMGDGDAVPQPPDAESEALLARARQIVDRMRASKARVTAKR